LVSLFYDGNLSIAPGQPLYTITTPMFDKITIELDPKYYKKKKNIVIEREINQDGKIKPFN
jgi:putative alpha-1,2-mannosidase